MLAREHYDSYISLIFGEDWNQDNFGPVIVPKDSLFVLGDNRSASADSRYIGFVSKSAIVATVLGKR